MYTTDDQNELFTHVDENDRVIGAITRAEAHCGTFMIHRGVWVLVTNDRDELFLQKRSLTKDSNPGLWSVSVGGHVASGQTYEDAAKREFSEELGVTPGPLELIRKFHFLGKSETEIGCVYKTGHNGPFFLDPDEIETGVFYPLRIWEEKVVSGELNIANWALAIIEDVYGILPERPERKECIIRKFT